jgi:hypothetical protein
MRTPLRILSLGVTLALTLGSLACRDAPSSPNAATLQSRTAPVSVPSSDIIILHDSRLDDADAAIEKAIVLLEASQNPGVKKPFGGHVEKAIRDLLNAREEIAAAAAYADQ